MKWPSLLLSIIVYGKISAQIVCGHTAPSHVVDGDNLDRSSMYIANGGVFTPRGDLRILVIFVSYGGVYDTLPVDGWDKDSEFPAWASNQNKAFYTDFSEFRTDIYSDTNPQSVSNFYYQMSQGNFRIVANYYPHRVRVDPTNTADLGSLHKMVLNQIGGNFNWSDFDNRKNAPNYQESNVYSSPDGIIDYIVFCHRFNKHWDSFPATWMYNINYDGATGTNLNMYPIQSSGGMRATHGFKLMSGGMAPISIFPHEMGHQLYNAPHYGGDNGVVGEYFYSPSAGWGMMRTDWSYSCAAGWERYILDWVPSITANGVPSDITATSHGPSAYVYELRDFITTGDAIRIKVPSFDNTNTYLWLENHQGYSVFDANHNGTAFCGAPIEKHKPGVTAYVEIYSGVKDSFFTIFDHGNGVRWLSRLGSHDFSVRDTSIEEDAICGNTAYRFFSGMQNPIGGQNVNENIRYDFDNNGHIEYNTAASGSIHNTAKNEQAPVVLLNGRRGTAKYFTGTGMQFQKGDKVGIAHNPCVTNIPFYSEPEMKLGNFYLNGISFKIIDQLPDGTMVVQINLDDVCIDKDVRWAAGSIILTDITGDARPDICVHPSVTMAIDKSGTPNRHKNPANPSQTSSIQEDFITPTVFTCRPGSYFKQEPHSTVRAIRQSTLVLDSGSVYEVGDGAQLRIEPSAALLVRNGATLRVLGRGHVEVLDSAHICIEPGAIVELVDPLSVVNLRQGHLCGLPDGSGITPSDACSPTPALHPVVGLGRIADGFATERCIQNTVYTHDAYETGSAIRAGHSVCQPPHGNVVILPGANIILDSEGATLLAPGIEVLPGATLEVR